VCAILVHGMFDLAAVSNGPPRRLYDVTHVYPPAVSRAFSPLCAVHSVPHTKRQPYLPNALVSRLELYDLRLCTNFKDAYSKPLSNLAVSCLENGASGKFALDELNALWVKWGYVNAAA
jgi:hypothetical protein